MWRASSVALAVSLSISGVVTPPAAANDSAARARAYRVSEHATVPKSRVGAQLTWLLGVSERLPLSSKEESSHFDGAFIEAEPVAQLNAALSSLASTGSTVTLVSLSDVTAASLVAQVKIGAITYNVDLTVDATGLISGLYFSLNKSATIPTVSTWSQIDKDLKKMAPDASFLAAQLNPNGTCSPVRAMDAATPRPLGSMFKLFILGALAHAVERHTVRWNQELTLTHSLKVGGSGELYDEPDGTKLTVEQTALKMISLSDNTAADMLLSLVGRDAVESQVRSWSSNTSLDTPFLSVAEFFVLKWHDFPRLADHYLSRTAPQRLSYLTSTIDRIDASTVRATSSPRDIESIEWFASPIDICHAFAGLSALEVHAELGPLNTILSTNNGGVALTTSTWPRIWFKGGSEPGVLTLGYLARDTAGKTYVVVVMLGDPKKPLPTSTTLLGLGVVAGAFNLLRASEHAATPGST